MMKKQILFLTFFVLAVFAGMTNSYGQTTWSAPRTVSCTDNALRPLPGKVYSYEAAVSDASTGTDGAWRFWATTDPNFITSPSGTPVFNTGTALTVGANQLVSASADYNIAIGLSDPNENTDGTITLSWSSAILKGAETTPTFVVAYYQDNAGCTDNIRVWELDPQNSFVVDVIAMDPAGFAASKNAYDATPLTCVSPVESAQYVSGAMDYDFGQNYLFFEFIAANFTGYWIPEFALTGNHTSQTLSYEYTTTTPDLWDGTTETWSPLVSGTTQISPDASVTDMSLGVSIFVRVTVDHDNYENLAGQTLTMTLDGVNDQGDYDVVNSTCVDPGAADQADTATSTITARPTVTPTDPTPFVTGNEQN